MKEQLVEKTVLTGDEKIYIHEANTNGSMFYGTDGALYFKGGSGTVTLIAPN